MSSARRRKHKDEKPGELPGPSQQGKANTCAAHSLGKSICNAGENHKPRLNFLQEESINVCIQKRIDLGGENIVQAGSWPTAWDNSSIFLKDNGVTHGKASDKTYEVKMKIRECNSIAEYDPNTKKEYVLVVDTNNHCVYIKELDKAQKFWNCWNSWGGAQTGKAKRGPKPNDDLKVPVGQPGNRIFEVDITIQEVDSEQKQAWANSKIKFEKVFAKLKTNTEKKQTTTINETIEQVNKIWQQLDQTHTSYVKEVTNAGDKEEAKRLTDELADIESDMDEVIALAKQMTSAKADIDNSLKITSEAANNARAENFCKESPKKETKKRGKLRQETGVTHVDSSMSEDSHEEEYYSDEDWESANKSNEQEETMNKKRISSGSMKKKNKSLVRRGWDMASNIVGNMVENVGKTVADTLSKIPVSKKEYEKFQVTLKDQLVSKWDETSESKVFHGVEIAKYEEFLEHFQTATGIDDKILAEFKAMKFTDRMDDKVKKFTCNGTDTEGKYGIYMALKRPQEEKIDVAYAMYTYKAEFVGNSQVEPNKYKIWKSERTSNGLYRLKEPLVENILTGKMMEPDRFFRKADVDELADNFIVTKALLAFAHYGVIPQVTYVEEQQQKQKINQETTPSIEEMP